VSGRWRSALRDMLVPPARSALRSLRYKVGSHAGLEIIYRELFVRELARLGIPDRFYPVGAAANHSLLYAVLRCYVEFPVTRILDVGAGQTSLLLDALRRHSPKAEVVTLEHDPAWAERIAQQVGHEVLRRDLVSVRLAGRTVRMHDTRGLAGPFDLIVMDAPNSEKRYSRLGLLHLMQTVMNRENFIVIMDDTDRGGEVQSVRVCREWLHSAGIGHDWAEIRAAKRQQVLAAGTLRHACFL
jgi:predicted O-methyltransferase YrrM